LLLLKDIFDFWAKIRESFFDPLVEAVGIAVQVEIPFTK
jgi:hypothetical protein